MGRGEAGAPAPPAAAARAPEARIGGEKKILTRCYASTEPRHVRHRIGQPPATQGQADVQAETRCRHAEVAAGSGRLVPYKKRNDDAHATQTVRR